MDSIIQGVSVMAILFFYIIVFSVLTAAVYLGIKEYFIWQLRK